MGTTNIFVQVMYLGRIAWITSLWRLVLLSWMVWVCWIVQSIFFHPAFILSLIHVLHTALHHFRYREWWFWVLWEGLASFFCGSFQWTEYDRCSSPADLPSTAPFFPVCCCHSSRFTLPSDYPVKWIMINSMAHKFVLSWAFLCMHWATGFLVHKTLTFVY